MVSQDSPGLESPQSFAQRIALPLHDIRLLSRALTHRSYLNEHPEALEDNERLEFLGDAVLDFVVGAWLYNHFPEMSEGEMTRLRAALVSTENLGKFGSQLKFGQALRMGHGEEDGGGRTRLAMLCNAFEAVIGAIYLDGGIESVNVFLDPLMERAVEEIRRGHNDRDPKSLLQELVQANGAPAPSYRIVAESGPDHSKHFEVEVVVKGEALGRGEGPSKQSASKMAARAALKTLEQKNS